MGGYNSKFNVNDLVRFKDKKADDGCLFGFIREVRFWKSDSVNFAVGYRIEVANTKEMKDVMETDIERPYS